VGGFYFVTLLLHRAANKQEVATRLLGAMGCASVLIALSRVSVYLPLPIWWDITFSVLGLMVLILGLVATSVSLWRFMLSSTE